MASVTVVSKGSLLEGRIVSDGEVIIEAGAEVRAEIRARRVIVRGIVRGDVIAPEVRLEEGGRVIGGLRTPAAEAAVQAANSASRPGARAPLTPAMADELALGIALDAAREITAEIEERGGGRTADQGRFEGAEPAMPMQAPSTESKPATPDPGASPERRVVAVRRKG